MNKNNKFWIVLFISPTIIIFLLFFAYPLGTVIFSSFTNWRLLSDFKFVGFENYKQLFFNDATFIKGFTNTLKWVLLQCTVYVGLGTLIALLTSQKSRLHKLFKTVYLIPNMISAAALSMVFYFLFQSKIGLVNEVIRALGFSDFTKNWFYEEDTAFFAVTIVSILYAGLITLLISAEISSISSSIYEAAKIDGADQLRINLYIVIPMLKNIIGTCMILASSWSLKSFEVIYLTSGGGPGYETYNLSLQLYREAMTNSNYGYANAIGVVIFILGISVILLTNKLMNLGKSYS